MSFGVGLGDFIAVSKLVKKLLEDFKNAPSELESAAVDVKNLFNVVQGLEDFVHENRLSDTQSADLQDICKGCKDTLKSLTNVVDSHQEVLTNQSNLSGKSRASWKRLRLDPQDIKDIRERLTANVTLLNWFFGRLTSQVSLETNENVAKLVLQEETNKAQQLKDRILGWLGSADHAAQHAENLLVRQEGSGQWLLNSKEYGDWISGESGSKILYCYGSPGSGKTIMSSIVIDDLTTGYGPETSFQLITIYIFLNYKKQHEQKLLHLWSSLLHQLLQKSDGIPDAIDALYKRHLESKTRPTLRELSDTLCFVFRSLPQGVLVVDAIDEYQTREGSQRTLVKEILSLQSRTGIRCFLTSRPLPGIVTDLEGGSTFLELRGSDDDLRSYIQEQIHQIPLPRVVLRDDDLQEQIITSTIEAVDGMFLLAKLNLESLSGKGSKKQLRLALNKLPKGSDAYDQAYDSAMDRIRSQRQEFVERAEMALSWIVCAKRPLRAPELQHAMAIEAGESDFDEDNIMDLDEILSVCAGLIIWDKDVDVVRLVHFTTQEYFDRTLSRHLPQAKDVVLEGCLTYLNSDAFTTYQFDRYYTSGIWPFYQYAAKNWGQHYLEIDERYDTIPEFLLNNAKVMASSHGQSPVVKDFNLMGLEITTGIALCADLGLLHLVDRFLSRGENPNHKRLLHIAARKGRDSVLELLLAHPDIDVNLGNLDHYTALHLAAKNNHESTVKLLLTYPEIDVNARTRNSFTALDFAATEGHDSVVELLIAHPDTEINARTLPGYGPLHLAAKSGHESVVKLLLTHPDVYINLRTLTGYSPLHFAAKNGHTSIAKLLLAHPGSDVNMQTPYSDSPLHLASMAGHEPVLQLLLAYPGIDVNARTSHGKTAYLLAVGNNHTAAVRLLAGTDAVDVDAMDRDNLDAVDLALQQGLGKLRDYRQYEVDYEIIRIVLESSRVLTRDTKDSMLDLLHRFLFISRQEQMVALQKCQDLLSVRRWFHEAAKQ